MVEAFTSLADAICGYPLFFLLIGGGLYLFFYNGMIPLRRLADAVAVLRTRPGSGGGKGQISSVEALASVVAATVGMGNIAGVAIALVMGGPGAIFWMWVSAIVGMSTKFHEGVLTIKYRDRAADGTPRGGTMHIIEQALGRQWRWLAVTFAVAGMMGTLCIMNANQLTEALTATFSTPEGIAASSTLSAVSMITGLDNTLSLRLICGLAIAMVVAVVVIGGIRRIASVASYLVPLMVTLYFAMVVYILASYPERIPGAIASIFHGAFNLRAGIGALAEIAIIGARRAALVNDAGVGTATIMHGSSANNTPVREGLIAMLGPSIDSGLVCTLTALALLVCGDITSPDIKGLEIALNAFGSAIPMGKYLLMMVVTFFAMSSMFSYSFYGTRCAAYLFGEDKAKYYTWFFILTLVVFAVIPLGVAVSLCDLFYAFMAFPTMFTLLKLRSVVRDEARAYFSPAPEEVTDFGK